MVTVVLDVEPAIPQPNDDPDSSQHDDSDPTVACIIIDEGHLNTRHRWWTFLRCQWEMYGISQWTFLQEGRYNRCCRTTEEDHQIPQYQSRHWQIVTHSWSLQATQCEHIYAIIDMRTGSGSQPNFAWSLQTWLEVSRWILDSNFLSHHQPPVQWLNMSDGHVACFSQTQLTNVYPFNFPVGSICLHVQNCANVKVTLIAVRMWLMMSLMIERCYG